MLSRSLYTVVKSWLSTKLMRRLALLSIGRTPSYLSAQPSYGWTPLALYALCSTLRHETWERVYTHLDEDTSYDRPCNYSLSPLGWTDTSSQDPGHCTEKLERPGFDPASHTSPRLRVARHSRWDTGTEYSTRGMGTYTDTGTESPIPSLGRIA